VIVAEAASPNDVVAEGVTSLPDVVVLKLATTDQAWLQAVGELTVWAPRTRLVAVSGLNARHLADLITTTAVVQSFSAARPPGARISARTAAGPDRVVEAPVTTIATDVAPRSIIHEVMRQVGLPVGRRR